MSLKAINNQIKNSLYAINKLKKGNYIDDMVWVVNQIKEAKSRDSKILMCGNGGSAADVQHFVGELVGRFRIERPGLQAFALTADSSVITAISNDYGYEYVFSRQIEALGQPGDILIAVTTSGNSDNIHNALIAARDKRMVSILFTGDNAILDHLTHKVLKTPTSVTSEVQECHKIMFHAICGGLDE